MKKIFIVHGWGSSSKGDWIPWLKSELERLGNEVFTPDMPDTENPVINEWVNKLSEVVGEPDENTYFIGHSIGCQAILRYLETVNSPVGGAVFVAGWFNLENLEDEESEEVANPWIKTPIDLEKVKKVLPKSCLIISDNDPYGAFEENKEKFAEVGSVIIEKSGAAHFSEDDGYLEIPEVIDQIKNF